jgi:Rod binding domain-containing protein
MDAIKPVCSVPVRALQETPQGVTTNVDRTDEKKQQVAKDFESVLLNRLFDQVQQTISSLNPEEDGTSQQVQGLFWLYLARDAADKGGFGLWKDIYQHLQQMDGVPNPADVLNEEL